MNHRTVPRFWRFYAELPPDVQTIADKNFQLIRRDAAHPSLQFKRVGKFWSARITDGYRALAVPKPDGFYWFWIGPHDEYECLIRS